MRRLPSWMTTAAGVALVGCAGLLVRPVAAQTRADAAYLLAAFHAQDGLAAASKYRGLTWQFVGPTNFSGRVTDIAVADTGGHRRIYVAGATGGVWATDDDGGTWAPVFEHEATPSIGDVTVAPSNPAIVWVGTGEDNIFRASLTGTGAYKSTDAGKTWTQMGLTDTGTIARIIVDPANPQVVYVAASGHEWTDNAERGVFKTTDGGRHWTKVFYRSPRTGAIDLVMDPSNPKTLYAAMWQRIRRKWSDPRVEPGYDEGGVWKTTDAGATWTPVNDGLAPAQDRGRIGLDISRSNPDVLYAIVDSYAEGRPMRPGEHDAYDRPLPDGSSIIRGAEVYRTDNGGRNWKKVSGLTPQTAQFMMAQANTYGWVFAQIRVDPKDPNTIYTLGLSVNVSHDAGATFTRMNAPHGDNHALWIDPSDPKVIYNGNDGGFAMTEDGGAHWRAFPQIHLTQFYNVEVDDATPFHIYGSIQDSGSYRVALDLSGGRDTLTPLAWQSVTGGEGSNFAIDPVDPNIFYSHGYYGNFTRNVIPAAGAAPAQGRGRGEREQVTPIRPKVGPNEPPLRGEWMAPIIVSHFDHKTIYAGYQYLFESHDMGDTWQRVSPDLTSDNAQEMGINPSAIPYQTIVQIAESPLKQGLLYVGTDDGHVWITQDDGKAWTELTKNLPEHKWISRIVASKYATGTVYVTERGREDDDFAPYVYKSTDSGKTWTTLNANLPAGPVNVIREDPVSANTLYLGNDFAAYISTDGGRQWSVLGGNLPTIEVSDLQIQPKADMIVISTYGRGMWVMDAKRVRAIR